jgi:hypothetical protein
MRPIGSQATLLSPIGALILALTVATARDGGHDAFAAGIDDSSVTITSFPETLDRSCRDGRAQLYDECGDQLVLFNAARRRAAGEGKVLLISYGAEWCIWCHVFDKYIHGEKTKFTYTYGTSDTDVRRSTTLYERAIWDVTAKADALKAYVSETFVVAHIESHFAPNGIAVLKQTGAYHHHDGGLPFIFTVDADGQFAARFEHDRVESRRDVWWDWYRGYSREGLMEHLSELRTLALAPGSK